MAKVVSVASSAEHRFSKQVQAEIHLIAGEGVEGDAHRGKTVQHLYLKRRDPRQPNLCQVHLFAAEMLEELAGRGFRLEPGAMGENILTDGIDLLALPRGTLLGLGPEAVVEITGLRTPCSRIDCLRIGLKTHLWGERNGKGKRTRRAGVMSIVRRGGTVTSEDEIRIELPPEPHLPLGPV